MQTGPGTELALITLVAFVSLVQKQLELWQFGRLSTGLFPAQPPFHYTSKLEDNQGCNQFKGPGVLVCFCYLFF